MFEATCIIMHSKTPICLPTAPLSTYWERPDSYGNGSLWENLLYDGDGEWIWDGLCGGSLCIAHDGSYMAEKTPGFCLAGVIIFCSSSQQWLKLSVTELSDTASNYCRELLGAVITLLILLAALDGLLQPLPHATLFCNNQGVLNSDNNNAVVNR
jgi:hypothetical protein